MSALVDDEKIGACVRNRSQVLQTVALYFMVSELYPDLFGFDTVQFYWWLRTFRRKVTYPSSGSKRG
jgi:hypothetical protein